MKKRLLFLLLAALATLPLYAYDFKVDGIYYNELSNGKECEVTYRNDSYNSYSGNIVIPETVTFYGNKYIVTSIGNQAFFGSHHLTSVTIPNSVSSIGYSVFEGCDLLEKITVEAENRYFASENGVLFNKDKSELVKYPTIRNGEYSIPNSVTEIGDFAFFDCCRLTSVDIPNSVTGIGRSAFSGCFDLMSVDIPNSVTEIGDSAFYQCYSLTSVTISNSVTSISSWAFSHCISLTSVDIPNSVTEIGEYAFRYCSRLTSVDIPNSVTSIGKETFYGCSGLTSVDIPNSVTSIGVSAFSGCSGLTSVAIPNSMTSIGRNIFYDCSGLTSVDIPNSVTSIGESAFSGCSGLTSVAIPNSVTSIGAAAFSDCSGLTSVKVPGTIKKIEAHTFANCTSLESVTIGNSVTEIDNTAFSGCTALTTIDLLEDNPNYSFADGVLFNKDKTRLIKCMEGKEGSYTVPNSVTTIGLYELSYTKYILGAFEGCSRLTSVVIPDYVTQINKYAFSGCTSLASISIGNSVTEIGALAFNGCTALGRIYSYAVTPPVCNGEVFSDIDKQLCELYVPQGCAVAYRAADQWKDFVNIVECPGEPLTLYRIRNKHHSDKYLTMDEDKMLIAADLDESNPQQLFKIETVGDKVTLSAQGTYVGEASHASEVQNGTSDTEPGLFYLVRNGDEVAFDKERPTGGTFVNGSRALSVPNINNAHVTTWATGTPYSWWYLEEVSSITLTDLAYCDEYYYANIALPFAFSTDVEVYTGQLNDNMLDLNETDHNFVEAGKPVIIRSALPEITLNIIEDSSENTPAKVNSRASDNHLSGSFFAADAPESAHTFCMLADTGKPAFAAEGRAIGRNESYLPSHLAGNDKVLLNLKETVGIDEVRVDGKVEVYDLRGVKVGESLNGLPHGLYIVKTPTKTAKIAI